jgi:hypothetical protein
MNSGIHVLHPETKEPLGLSKNTAYKAVLQTATSRIVLATPIFLPSLMLASIEKVNMMPRGYYSKMGVTGAVFCL